MLKKQVFPDIALIRRNAKLVPPMNNWKITSGALLEVAKVLSTVWEQVLPPRDCLPSGAQEALCDEWCGRLAANMHEVIHPPADVQPWVLARLVTMAGKAAELDRSGEAGAPALTESILRVFLIDEWHKRLARVWKQNRVLHSAAA